MIKVSIIVPTLNRCDTIKRLLSALSIQTFPAENFEVIVSIDGSEDGTSEMIENFSSPYRLLSTWAPNAGRATACNRGIRMASGEIIIILDDDMEPTPKLVEKHFQSHTTMDNLAVIGACPIAADESTTFATMYIAEEFNSRQNKMAQEEYKLQIWDFYGGNLSIRRDLILKVGAFNELFRIYGYEDIELAHRLVKSGIDIKFNPHALCIQHHNEDLRRLSMKTISSGKTTVFIVNLHPDLFYELKLREYNLTGWKWRGLRLSIIRLSMLVPFTIDVIIFCVDILGTIFPRSWRKLYSLALDVFFWYGVWSEIAASKKIALMNKIKSYKFKLNAN